jgi:DNA-binding response OmpR family regulator
MSVENTPKVLLVEDDEFDRVTSEMHLLGMGLGVTPTDCPFHARDLFATDLWQLVVIHLGNAQDSSLELCRWIRAESTVPIIMLTHRGEVIDEVMALNAGADDYALKPVSEKIFTARVNHQLKRHRQSAPNELEPLDSESGALVHGILVMDLQQYRFFVAKTEVGLTKSEFQMMRLLLENRHQVLTRAQFLHALGVLPGIGSDHIVDAHASRLRSKIRSHGGGEVLKSVRGVGLRLAEVMTHGSGEPATA